MVDFGPWDCHNSFEMRRLLAVGLAALALAIASAGDAAQNFLDRRGDAHGAPDIFTLYLQDRWGGKPDFLYFGFGISDLPGKLLVDFDTDKNAATGGPSGSDYRVEVAVQTGGARLLRWSGNRFSPVASPTLRGYGPGPEFSLSRIDIGGTRAFRFWLTTTKGRARDRAPDVGAWTFSLVKADAGAGPFLLSDPEPDPKGVHAGKPFSLSSTVNRRIPTRRSRAPVVSVRAT